MNSGAAALAQAVLSPALKSVGLNNVSAVTMSMSPIAFGSVSLGQQLFSNMSMSTTNAPTGTPVSLTDVTHLASEKEENSGGTGSDISGSSSVEEKTRKISVQQKRGGEVYV